MTDHKSMLCVGGPRSGQRYAVLYGSGFKVPIKTDVPQNDHTHPDWQPNKPVKVEFADYREETFHTPQGDVSFWTPEGQTPLETIKILLETYERAQIKSPLKARAVTLLENTKRLRFFKGQTYDGGADEYLRQLHAFLAEIIETSQEHGED